MATKKVKINQVIEDSHNYLDERNKVHQSTDKFYPDGGDNGDGVYDMEESRASKLIALGPAYAEEVAESE